MFGGLILSIILLCGTSHSNRVSVPLRGLRNAFTSRKGSILSMMDGEGPMICSYRNFDEETDWEQLISLARELQAHEFSLYDRMKPPASIDSAYVEGLKQACKANDGRILVCVQGESTLVGYAVVLAKVASDSKDEVSYKYGEVLDLAVSASARQQGIGKSLLKLCEDEVRAKGCKYLRTEVLASNEGAVAAYRKFGFENHLVTMEKKVN